MAEPVKRAKKDKGLDDEDLLAIVEAEFRGAMGKPDGDIASERSKAWNFYLGKPLGNEIDGQSKVVSNDTSEVVDSIMPSLLRIFTTADNLVSFDPVDAEDEPKAAQESDYVNYVFFKQNPSFLILYTWFLDALVQKNGVVKAWWNKTEKVTQESYEGLTDDELTMLMDNPDLEPTEHATRTITHTEMRPVPMGAGMPGMPPGAPPGPPGMPGAPPAMPPQGPMGLMPVQVETTVYDVKFRRTCKSGRVCVEPVPPEQYRISADARSVEPGNARMVGQERDDVTRTELLEMGFDAKVVDKLPAHSPTGTVTTGIEKAARYDKVDEQEGMTSSDRSMDKIQLREAYIRVDYDGDDIAELRQVFIAGNEVLSNEVVDRSPFHIITPQILPHKHFGRATAERVMDIQEVNTTLLRQILTNLYHSNNPGSAIWEQAIGENTLDDLLTTRVGRVVRFNRPVSDSFAPMAIPFTAQQTFPMLEYFDKVKRDRTGVSSDSQGLSPDALKNIQTSVLAASVDMSRMKQEAIARIFAETGIRSLFMHIHELCLKHQKKEQIVKLRGEWVPVNPAEWHERTDMTVNIGLGIGTREQNLLHLNAIAEKQQQIVTAGGMNLIVTPKNVYNTCAELVKNANLKSPDMFFTDPGDKPAPPPSDQAQELQAQQQKQEERRQQLDAMDAQLKDKKIQLQAQEAAMNAQADKQAQDMKHIHEMIDLKLKHEAQSDKVTVDMEKIRNALTEMELKYATNVPGSRV
jgi:hypothetical protein